MRVFYDKRQSVPGNLSFSPSAGNPAQVFESWKSLGIPFSEQSFSPLTVEDIALAHDREYEEMCESRGTTSCNERWTLW